MRVILTYFIYTGWVKNTSTSTLAFDIAQFFPLLNHQILPLILNKARFNSKILSFFYNYLVDRKSTYLWNNFSSPSFNVDVGGSQVSALSPLLFVLYLSPILHIFEKQLKNLKIPISILSFIDNVFFVTQNKSLIVSNLHLLCSYHIISSLLKQFRLILKYRKMEVFYFSRSHRIFDLPSLDLILLGGPILLSKNTWQYLRFIFDRKLTFQQHIEFYTNKAISTIKCINMLRNSSRGLIPTQKWLLYRSCVLPITPYGFQLWYYNKTPLLYSLKELRKM